VPLGLGDDGITDNVVVVAVAVRLGGRGRDKESRGNRSSLHLERIAWVVQIRADGLRECVFCSTGPV
jgi:hypothetical protein